jgi:hypothetical protein
MPATQVTEGAHRLTQGVVDRGHDRGPAAGEGGRAVLAFQP